jgi:hypothetical protein
MYASMFIHYELLLSSRTQGWAAGDVSLAAYIQSVLTDSEFGPYSYCVPLSNC